MKIRFFLILAVLFQGTVLGMEKQEKNPKKVVKRTYGFTDFIMQDYHAHLLLADMGLSVLTGSLSGLLFCVHIFGGPKRPCQDDKGTDIIGKVLFGLHDDFPLTSRMKKLKNICETNFEGDAIITALRLKVRPKAEVADHLCKRLKLVKVIKFHFEKEIKRQEERAMTFCLCMKEFIKEGKKYWNLPKPIVKFILNRANRRLRIVDNHKYYASGITYLPLCQKLMEHELIAPDALKQDSSDLQILALQDQKIFDEFLGGYDAPLTDELTGIKMLKRSVSYLERKREKSKEYIKKYKLAYYKIDKRKDKLKRQNDYYSKSYIRFVAPTLSVVSAIGVTTAVLWWLVPKVRSGEIVFS